MAAAETRSRRAVATEHANFGSKDSEQNDKNDDEAPNESPLARLNSGTGEEYATFSLRHGLQDADPNVLRALMKVGIFICAGGAVLAFRRLLRRDRLDVANAWAWSADEAVPVTDQLDLAKPLMGTTLVIGEKCVSRELRAAALLPCAVHNHSCVAKLLSARSGKKTTLNVF